MLKILTDYAKIMLANYQKLALRVNGTRSSKALVHVVRYRWVVGGGVVDLDRRESLTVG